jgi:hypothetical protein
MFRRLIVMLGFVLSAPVGVAGMPSLTVTELASARLDAISFFLLIYLLCALVFRWLWNALARDFPALPRLSYKGALGVLVVAGVFVYFILTMISGARELMTPGAWVKQGATYQLASQMDDPKAWLNTARKRSFERIRDELHRYSLEHGGKLPDAITAAKSLPADLWKGIDPVGNELCYMAGRSLEGKPKIIAYEPRMYGTKRWVLLTDWTLLELPGEELEKRLVEEFVP